MSENASSIASLLSTLMLSDAKILKKAWDEPFARKLQWAQWRECAYLAYQPWSATYPDHVFDASWRSLEVHDRTESWLLCTLDCLVDEYLEVRHGSIYVRSNLFGVWQQSFISRVSCLPVHAMAIDGLVVPLMDLVANQNHKQAKWARETLPLLRPYSVVVDDYVEREGLHESHLHLNGSTHAEICWLRAIHAPKKETDDFVRAWTKGRNAAKVRELVGQVNSELRPAKFWEQLRAAAEIRKWLIAAATGSLADTDQLPVDCASLGTSSVLPPESNDGSLILSPSTTIWDELYWQARLIRKLKKSNSTQLGRMFHCYLLIQNQYYRLMVQSETQFGFDQFQKLTLTDLREPVEKDYLHRFQSMMVVTLRLVELDIWKDVSRRRTQQLRHIS